MRSSVVVVLGAAVAASWASEVLVKTIVTADDILARSFDSLLTSRYTLEDRAGSTGTGSTDINMTEWSANTKAACQSTLGSLPRVASPSGMAICLNLLSLDTRNGIFEADVGLYRASAARDAWVGVLAQDTDVNVNFANAQVTSVSEDQVSGMGLVGGKSLNARQADDEPALLQSYMLIGQINEDQMKDNMTMSDFERLVMPNFSLTAPTTAGNLTSQLSPNEAAFLTGVFSDMSPTSALALAQAEVDKQTQRLEDGEVAFVLPGTQLLIFPIGLIITLSWAVIGFAAYGFGTVERWRYREMYRERAGIVGGRIMSKRMGI
ncbi:hypothetical protein GMORB2_4311 [Geosmithia morbida]|uniref:Uncharacterized protein n=1 Tax=Geosmithia morbida TaxID=1094350 RepID=A0A9P4Z130_9HYPO|nr:uncharacterized protein GMORB2_4311 [Geosmithia morbida]KAF4125471.1 hypothetical protein GMORB2_4311 [Geosmithia morbida]